MVFQSVGLTIGRTTGDPGVTPAIAPRDPVILLEAKFAISEEGSGSITRVVQNRALRDIGLLDSELHELSGAIRALPALVEEIWPDGSPPTALAAFDFMQFGDGTRITPDKKQSVGSVTLRVQSPNYHHAQATDTEVDAFNLASSPEDMAAALLPLVVDTLVEVIGPETDAKKNGVTFSSNYFQFPSKVTIGCDGSSDIRVKSEDDESVYENVSKPQQMSQFVGPPPPYPSTFVAKTLCIQVDGETEIPVTDTYKVTTEYEGVDDAAFPPPGGTQELAAIEHDGTSYRLPYLTTFEGYNQRFSIVNRGAATTYAFTGLVSPEGAVTPGPRSIGPLPTGQTVLRTEDVVSLTGTTRAAGNLTIVADPGTLSAAIQQVNTVTRTVDTVYLEHNLK